MKNSELLIVTFDGQGAHARSGALAGIGGKLPLRAPVTAGAGLLIGFGGLGVVFLPGVCS